MQSFCSLQIARQMPTDLVYVLTFFNVFNSLLRGNLRLSKTNRNFYKRRYKHKETFVLIVLATLAF